MNLSEQTLNGIIASSNSRPELWIQFLKVFKIDSMLELGVARGDFAASKRIILQGKTTEVIDQINDNELDFAYIDGDHTLKGITIDLIHTYNFNFLM